ncbi:2-octaprenylphenol hydroxylase [Kordia antarctica]|uniref:2-octaprenylphenol hydroxylase n=1 Tax=Kordia antarctica TaxID=1218801 RepID=A0A7L4ZQU9_9FLAO|nr:NAD(P)/FAD-dependent oxidoreductase [Kordia antarctica]QHI39103.1 2-octaprenylphenol hydroxylase [Kordia antarctica]
MKTNAAPFNVIIIGGGLAGLSSAIHLSKENSRVLVIEKNAYPKHKVCGEYISNEVLPYFDYLGIDVFDLGAQKITKFELSTPKNKLIKATLPLGGFGISRYTLDNALAEMALQNGAKIIQDSVIDVQFSNDAFSVQTKNETFHATIVIGAFGKRSSLDIKLDRNFIKKKSPFLAVKMHVKGDFPNDLVALHNFKGGYCGVSKVENDSINLCYITNFEAFKKYKDIDEFQEEVIFKNNYLKAIFKNSQPVFETPLTISQISFATKNPIENHIIMCGDTAGMIHPLCGNGMSMAIRSAQMASQLISMYLQGKIESRVALEKAYQKSWNKEFKNRLRVGHFAANIFSRNQLAELLIPIVKYIPSLLPKIITRTHGKPMIIK